MNHETAMPKPPPAAALTADEERELAARHAMGDRAARDRLILSHLKLARKIAALHRGRGVASEDLIQEGCLGLIRASSDFHPDTHGCRFAAYAEVWVRAFIFRAIHLERVARGDVRRPHETRLKSFPSGLIVGAKEGPG